MGGAHKVFVALTTDFTWYPLPLTSAKHAVLQSGSSFFFVPTNLGSFYFLLSQISKYNTNLHQHMQKIQLVSNTKQHKTCKNR